MLEAVEAWLEAGTLPDVADELLGSDELPVPSLLEPAVESTELGLSELFESGAVLLIDAVDSEAGSPGVMELPVANAVMVKALTVNTRVIKITISLLALIFIA